MTLWAFFDESGEHHSSEAGGGLKRLTIGGCIASFETWESLSLEWASALEAMGLEMFHMKESKKGLGTFLDIMGAAKLHCWGSTNTVREGEPDRSVYKRCATDLLAEFSMLNESVEVVFARYQGFKAFTALHEALEDGYGKGIRRITTDLPIDMCPLQAADIVAYEMRNSGDHGRGSFHPPP